MRGRIVTLAALALACAGPSAGSEATHSATALVFVQDSWVGERGAPPRLTLCAAGAPTAQARAVTPGGADQEPAVAPSGAEVAFVRGQFGAGRLQRVPATGGDVVELRPDLIAYYPSWTPDGARIVFSSPGPNAALADGLDVYSVRRDGGDLRRLTTDPARETMAAVSPDGRRIAYVRGTSDLGGGQLWIADADGAAPRRAVALAGVSRPSWAPDGSALVFAAGGSIWRLPLEEDAAAVPLQPGAEPAYSPDGTHVAFVRDGDVWLMRPDGSDVVNVTHSPVGEREPAWLRAGVPAGSAQPCAIVGTEESDVLVGTDGPDEFYDIGGNDVIDARGGDDHVFDGQGDDQIRGGEGNDEIVITQGSNRVGGGEGNDLLTAQGEVAARAPNVLMGDGGDDSVFGGAADDRLLGGDGNDTIFGGAGRDAIAGGAGADRIEGNADDDAVDGGAGDDALFGGVRETGLGGVLNGNDLLVGGPGADMLAGGPGRDDLVGGPGADRLLGGSGSDRLRGDGGADLLGGDSGDDVLLARDRTADDLRGGAGRDSGRIDRGVDVFSGLERLLP